MKTKAIVIGLVVLALSLIVGAVSAQGRRGNADNRPGNRFGLRVQNGVMGELHDIMSEATGLTEAEIHQQVRDGATLAEIIEANGGNVEDVTAQVIAAVTERVEEAIASGNLTEEQGTGLLQALEERVIDILNQENLIRAGQGIRPQGRNPQGRFLARAVAEATGLDATDVISQVREGATLAEILTSNDIDLDVFVDEQTAQFKERLDERVADGDISQAVAHARLNLFQVELLDRLNRTFASDSE